MWHQPLDQEHRGYSDQNTQKPKVQVSLSMEEEEEEEEENLHKITGSWIPAAEPGVCSPSIKQRA